MKSRSRNHFLRSDIPLLNGHGKPPLTFDQFIEKWAGVFEDDPEFFEEVRKARGCNCHERLTPGKRQ